MNNKMIIAAIAAVSMSIPAYASGASPTIYGGVETGFDHVSAHDVAHGNGLVYGGVLGVQQKVDNDFVLGLEAEAMGATTRKSYRDNVGDNLEIKAGRDLAVSLRAGYIANPSLLLYLKGGYTNARFTADYNDGEGDSLSGGTNLNGYRLGTGFEAGSGKLRFRAEYRYSNYGNLQLFGIRTGVTVRRQQVIAGIIYGF